MLRLRLLLLNLYLCCSCCSCCCPHDTPRASQLHPLQPLHTLQPSQAPIACGGPWLTPAHRRAGCPIEPCCVEQEWNGGWMDWGQTHCLSIVRSEHRDRCRLIDRSIAGPGCCLLQQPTTAALLTAPMSEPPWASDGGRRLARCFGCHHQQLPRLCPLPPLTNRSIVPAANGASIDRMHGWRAPRVCVLYRRRRGWVIGYVHR